MIANEPMSDIALWFAIGEVLSDWKESMTVDEVLSEVELMTDDVAVWEPFAVYDGPQVVEIILELAYDVQMLIDQVKKKQK